SPRPPKLVRGQASLHQQLALASVNRLAPPRRRNIAVRPVDDLAARDVEVELACDVGNLYRGPDQNGLDDPGLGGIDGPAKRGLVARMHHDSGPGRHPLSGHDQALVFRSGRLANRRAGSEPGFLARAYGPVSLFRIDRYEALDRGWSSAGRNGSGFASSSTSKSWATRERRCAASPRMSPLAVRIWWMAAKPSRRAWASSG